MSVMSLPLRYCLLLFLVLISACSDESTETPKMLSGTTQSTAGQLKVTSINEALFRGKPVLAVNFSASLDALRSYDDWLTVHNEKTHKVNGNWVLSSDGRSLYFSNIRPRQSYTVKVSAGLSAKDHATLTAATSLTLTVNNRKPVVGFSGKGMIIPAGSAAGLPVRSVNVKAVQVDYFRLPANKLSHLLNDFKTASSRGNWEIGSLLESASLIYSAQYQLSGDANTRVESKLPLDKKVTGTPGIYFAVLTRPGVYLHDKSVTYFTVSDIGLHLREYANKLVVFASTLKTAEVNSAVKIRVLDNKGNLVVEGITDKHGRVELANHRYSRVLIASKGDQLAVLNISGPALDISEFDLPTKAFQSREYFIYGPRDLYRPGEELDFSILMRDFDGKLLPSMPLIAELVRPDGVVANTQRLASQAFNYYHFRYQLAKAAQTGTWKIRVRLQGKKQASTAKSFLVEDFLPERIRVDFSAEEKTVLSVEQLKKISVKAEYLYGAPAAENKLSASVRIRLARSPFSSLKAFVFGETTEKKFDRQYDFAIESLDTKGEAVLKLNTRISNNIRQVNGPAKLDYRASVFESGGRAVERALTLYHWQKGIWPGIKADFDIDNNTLVNLQAGFQLISVTEDGKPLTGRELSVTLVNLNRQSYWEYSEGNGWYYQHTDKPFDTWQQQFVTTAEPLRIQVPVEKGFYQLRVTDKSGNTSTLDFKIGQNYWWGYGKQDNAARPDKITVTLEHPYYKAGEKIKLQLQSPRPGKGFLIVESSEGILFHQAISLGEKAQSFEIPIPAGADSGWQRHDVRIVAMAVQPETQARRGIPMRSIGMLPLPLDRTDRKIKLIVTTPEKVEPQTQLKLELNVEQAQVKEIMVTVAAVDQGVLSVSNFKTPDPWAYFYQLRRPQVDARDNFAEVLHLKDLAFARQRYGGDAAALTRGGEKPESEVQIVALFKGPVRLDEQGRAEIEFDMPDFNGAVRLMVVAYSEQSFGSAEAEVKVKAPIVTQLALPRFAAFGDQTQLTLDIQNTQAEQHELTLNWEISGVRLVNTADKVFSLILEPNQKKVIQLPVKISQASGTADIKLHITGNTIDFKRQWHLGLRPAYPAETFKQLAILKTGESTGLKKAWLKGKLADSLQLELSLSAEPPLNIRKQWRSLLSYPYGCLEQTTSRARPLSIADEQLRQRWQVQLPLNLDRVKAVQDAINRLQTMQRSEGGFGLWSAHSTEEFWLTVYVTEFLLAARDKGFQVPDRMLNPALNRLQDYVKGRRISQMKNDYYGDIEHYRFAYRSYAAFVLATQAKAPLGTLRQWFDKYGNESKSPLPLAHLAVALKLQGDSARAAKAVNLAEKTLRNTHTYLGDYGSPLRDQALLLTLNIKYALQLQDADAKLFKLSASIYRKTHLSTQERDAILQLALALDTDKSADPWVAELSIAAEKKAIKGPESWLTVIKGKKVKDTRITVTGKQRLFSAQTLVANSITAPKKQFKGFSIKREWFDTSGKPINHLKFTTGDYVIVRLRVRAEQRSPNALIVDLLPAGFELENPALAHSTPLARFSIEGEALRENNAQYEQNIKYKEYRDDRFVAAVDLRKNSTLEMIYLIRAVTPGTYQVPSALVEDMYQPEYRSIGVPFDAVTVIAQSSLKN